MNKRHNKFFVYILEDKNGVYYTGFTGDLAARIEKHNQQVGAKYLKGRGPVKLVFAKEYHYYKNALTAERRIKTYTRKRKEELIRIFNTKANDR